MARYEYVTQSARGAPFLKAFADAPSLTELNSRLIHLNKPVIKVFDPPVKRAFRRTRSIPLALRLRFLEQLEASCYLGMDFRTALGICVENTSRRSSAGRQLATVIGALRDKVTRGVSFARAVGHFPLIFDEVSTGLI